MKFFEPKYELKYSFLKWSAIIWMTYDHILKTILNINETNIILFPGRFAFPLFAFIIAWHLHEKKIFAKYIKRLFPFAIVSLVVDIFYYNIFPLNIMFTFMFSILTIWVIEQSGKGGNKYLQTFVTCYALLFSFLLDPIIEYHMFGIWLIPSFYLFLKTKSFVYYALSIAILTLIMPCWTFSFLIAIFASALLLVKPVKDKRHSSFKKTGWMFYAYYPIHKFIIAIIALVLSKS